MSYAKVLILLIAVLAIDAFVAPAAQAIHTSYSNTAKEKHPHEGGGIVFVHAKHPDGSDGTSTFTAGEGFGGVTCGTAIFEGMTAGTAEELLTTPSFGSCVDSFGRTVDVSTNSCQYQFYATSETSSDMFTGAVDIANCGGSSIETKITSGGSVVCTVKIGAQTGLGPIHYENMTKDKPTDITATSTASNVRSTTSGGFFNCGIANGEHLSGNWKTNLTGTVTNAAAEPMDVKWEK